MFEGHQDQWDETADPCDGGWVDQCCQNTTGKWCTDCWYQSRF